MSRSSRTVSRLCLYANPNLSLRGILSFAILTTTVGARSCRCVTQYYIKAPHLQDCSSTVRDLRVLYIPLMSTLLHACNPYITVHVHGFIMGVNYTITIGCCFTITAIRYNLLFAMEKYSLRFVCALHQSRSLTRRNWRFAVDCMS